MILMNQEKYVERNGLLCPDCLSDQIEDCISDTDNLEVTARVICHNCNAVWADVYTLTDVYMLTGFKNFKQSS